MKDVLYVDLKIGDEVIVVKHYDKSSGIKRGKVVGITPKRVKVDCNETNYIGEKVINTVENVLKIDSELDEKTVNKLFNGIQKLLG